ncbi:MAG: FtsX-like permease family protein [Chloroflexota bacterium]
MLLSLAVSTALIVAMSATVETIRRSNIDLISTFVGRFDLEISKTEISPDPFVDVSTVSDTMLAADDQIMAVYPRIIAQVELSDGEDLTTATLIGRLPDEPIGQLEVISGTESLENRGVLLYESTAESFGFGIGDEIDISYSFPLPRESGEPLSVGVSQRRVRGIFTINGIVRQNGIVGDDVRDGVFIDFAEAQAWLQLEAQASSIIGVVDPAVYEAGNSETAALSVRDIGINVQRALGDEYRYALNKATALDQSSEAFLVLQALINTYGLMAFGVVGLLIHTLVMTNVQEQRRELAILRILGSLRNYLFAIVMTEVAIIGVIGVGVGVVLGQLLTRFAVVPFIESQIANEANLSVTITPEVSLAVIIPSVLSAFAVLFISALRPAQDASRTKVMHAINPGVADNIQLEDLEGLREQRPNVRLFAGGLVLLFAVFLALGFDIVSGLGIPALEATFFFAALLLMVLGIGLVFLIITRPLERLILFFVQFIAPRMTFFAQRNVGRSNKRNTLISLLVLFSGVLPSFLATQNAINFANIDTNTRLDMGAPISMQVFSRFDDPSLAYLDWLEPSFIENEIETVDGINQAIGLSRSYFTSVSDVVQMRSNQIEVMAVSGDLNQVLFDSYVEFIAGDRSALTEIVDDDQIIIISEALSNQLAVPLGGTIELNGEGLDHTEEYLVIGIARRLPGFSNVARARSRAEGSSAIISLDAFHRLTTNPKEALPDPDSPVFTRILATVEEGADVEEIDLVLRQNYGFENGIWTRVFDVELQQAQDEQRQSQVFLLVLTLLSFTTAVFGVFAVIYVTIYARRLEIGMMKAVGTRNWELTGMLSIESIAMTLSAALAGIIAGAAMGYFFAYLENVQRERPMVFTIDTTVMPFVVIMVVLASIIGTIFSARRIIRFKAIEILRMN